MVAFNPHKRLRANNDLSRGRKVLFYQRLNTAIREIRAAHKMIILADFKAHAVDDHLLGQKVLGKHRKGRANSNGELLFNMCTEVDIAITNTYFKCLINNISRGNTLVQDAHIY